MINGNRKRSLNVVRLCERRPLIMQEGSLRMRGGKAKKKKDRDRNLSLLSEIKMFTRFILKKHRQFN